MNYYNEHDAKAAAWLRELIKRGHIPDGIVDERSIEDVVPSEIAGFTQCHFFAGIGGWSLALQLAGWPEDRPVWTGSCPCQPFSSAGKGSGFADERHLWPAFHHLISQCQPPTVFGEQVASKDGLAWLDLVHADCEASGYAFGASDLCAAGIGAPHIRQRLWWVANRIQQGLEGHCWNGNNRDKPRRIGANTARPVAEGGDVGRMADSDSAGPQQGRTPATSTGHWDSAVADGRDCRMAHTGRQRDEPGRGPGDVGCEADQEQGEARQRERSRDASSHCSSDGRPSPLHGFWRDADWLFCRDGKWRPVESATIGMVDGIFGVLVPSSGIMPASFPLAQNQERRVMRLRGYGNAIVPQVAATFIEATGLIQ